METAQHKRRVRKLTSRSGKMERLGTGFKSHPTTGHGVINYNKQHNHGTLSKDAELAMRGRKK